jgi:bacillopeptidase F
MIAKQAFSHSHFILTPTGRSPKLEDMSGKFQFLALLCCLLSLFTPLSAQISDGLEKKLGEGEASGYYDIYILLSDRVDAALLEARFEKDNLAIETRVPTLIETLKEKAAATQPLLMGRLSKIPGVVAGSFRTYWVANVIFLRATADAIQEIASDPAVALIDENYALKPIGLSKTRGAVTTAVPGGREPGITAINAPALWALGYTGYGRKAMIIDTGEDLDHPAIRNQFLGQTAPESHAWSGTSDPGPCLSDDFGVASHGTHVTGTIVGLDRANRDTIGVAFNGQWMAGGVNLSGCDGYEGGSAESIVANFEWALDPDGNPTTILDMPDVINNSWGRGNPPESHCDGNFSLSLDLADALYAAGTALVFSAGNDGPGDATHVSPAFISSDTVKVFSVGAVNGNIGNLPIAGFSSRGPTTCDLPDGPLKIKPEVVAPGVNVRSAVIGGGYQQFSGTSMASPHVAGAILLLKEAFPFLTGEELMKALYFTAHDLGEEGEDNTYGRGMIDVEDAFLYLIDKGYTPEPPANRARDLTLIEVQTNGYHCDGRFQPSFVVENNGTETVSSFDVLIESTSGTPASFLIPVTQTLEPGARRNILLPEPADLPEGQYILRFELVNPDSISDDRPLNNSLLLDVQVSETPSYFIESLQIDPLCANGSALARYIPADTSELVYWFDAITEGQLLGTGNEFLSPPLSSPEDQLTLWAELRHTEQTGAPEPDDDGNQDPSDFASEGGLIFDAHRPFILKAVSINALEKTGAVVVLKDQFGSTLETVPTGLNSGWNRVSLDLEVPRGNGFLLSVSTGNQELLQESGIIGYPFEVEDILSINASTDSLAPYTLYPFFFEWEIEYANVCSRVPLTLELSDAQAPGVTFLINSITSYSDGSFALKLEGIGDDIQNWSWETDPLGLTATGKTPMIEFPEGGVYTITLNIVTEEGCAHAVRRTIELGQATGTEAPERENPSFIVHPNPTDGRFSILPVGDWIGGGHEEMSVVLYDQLGRQVYGPVRFSGIGPAKLEVGTLPGGLYMVRISVGSQHMVTKVVIR